MVNPTTAFSSTKCEIVRKPKLNIWIKMLEMNE